MDHVLLYLGCERSGTTFVSETLNRFYDVAHGNEPGWVVSKWRELQRDPALLSTRVAQTRWIRELFTDWWFANMANYYQVYFNVDDFVQDGPFDYRKFVSQIFEHIGLRQRKRWVINKACAYCDDMEAIDQVYGDPHVVHIVRDGRDVAISLMRVAAWGPTSAFGAAELWKRRVDRFQGYASQRMRGRVLELSYEKDLLANPIETFERIAKWYGIFEEHRHAELQRYVEVKENYESRWKTRISPSQVAIIERVAWDTLERNGYALTDPAHKEQPLTPWERLGRRALEAVSSRVSPSALLYRGMRVTNKLIGRFPALQDRLSHSDVFARYFRYTDSRSGGRTK